MPDPSADNDRTRSSRQTVSLDAPTRYAPAVGGEVALQAADGRRYELKYEIASGGMGRIFLAEDLVFHREVAVKILRDDLRGNAAVTARFLDEAVITGQLQHPAIPPVHDLGTQADGRPFLVMKLIKGHTLSELLAAGTRVTGFAGGPTVSVRPPSAPGDPRPVNLLAVFEQVCQAVGYAHQHGVIHRDLKPSNVMVGSFGEVQLMDWGLAKLLANHGRDPAGSSPDPDATPHETEVHGLRAGDRTMAGSVYGTPGFMPPEQARGHVAQVDRRSDVYGLGALLCVILTGQPPHHPDDPQATRPMSAHEEVSETAALLDGCGADPELVALCKRCLSRSKADRPADGGEVAAAVGAYRVASERRARAAEVAAARAVEQRKRAGVWAAFAVTAIVVAAAGGGGWLWVQAEWQAEQARVQAGARRETATKVSDTCVALAYQMLDKWRIADAQQDLELCERVVGPELPPDARGRLAAARTDAAFAARLDAIRSRFHPAEYDGTPEPYHEYARREYRAAFRDHGFDDLFDAPATVAKLKASPISRHLLAALDNWMFNEPDTLLRSLVWALTTGVGAESWRLKVATEWRTPAAVKRLLADTPPADRTPALYDFVGSRLEALEPDQDTGRAVFVQGHTQHPDDPWLYYKTAVASVRHRDYPRAVTALRTMLAIRPESAYGWRLLAWTQRAQGGRPPSAAAAEKAVALAPADWRAHLELALAAFPTDRERARAAYAQAAELAPDNPWPFRSRGQSEFLALQFDEAAAALREAVRRDPKPRHDHLHAGHAAVAGGNREWAAEAYRGALKLNPKDGVALWGLAMLAVRAGDPDRAIEHVAAAGKSVSRDQLHERYASHLLGACPPPVATGIWAAAAAKSPDDPHAAFVLGLIHFKQNRFADAARELARADALGRKSATWPYPTARWAADAAAKAKSAK